MGPRIRCCRRRRYGCCQEGFPRADDHILLPVQGLLPYLTLLYRSDARGPAVHLSLRSTPDVSVPTAAPPTRTLYSPKRVQPKARCTGLAREIGGWQGRRGSSAGHCSGRGHGECQLGLGARGTRLGDNGPADLYTTLQWSLKRRLSAVGPASPPVCAAAGGGEDAPAPQGPCEQP